MEKRLRGKSIEPGELIASNQAQDAAILFRRYQCAVT